FGKTATLRRADRPPVTTIAPARTRWVSPTQYASYCADAQLAQNQNLWLYIVLFASCEKAI
ncbi:hypothetical protein, partial [Chromobacterium fluminis]|uniref:hypothetical protein n=1 Tax=Chromobacterium fluminis TaxID=3044269 RepID=UPI001980ADF0